MPPASFRFHLTMNTLAFGYVIPAIRAYSGLPPVRKCSCRAYQEQRAAKNITRPELVNKLLRTIDKMIDSVEVSENPDVANGLGDKLAKIAATIEKLDKRASVVDAIEVFMAFGKWLQFQAQFDESITPELMKKIMKYQDQYINYLMQNKLM